MRDQLDPCGGFGPHYGRTPSTWLLERLLRAAAAADPACGLGRRARAARCTIQEETGVEKQ